MAPWSHAVAAASLLAFALLGYFPAPASSAALRRLHRAAGDASVASGNSTNRSVGEVDEPARLPKPELMLTFQMLVRSSSGSVANVSADAARFAISVMDATPIEATEVDERRRLPRDGSVLDFRHGREFSRQRFFDELVCYMHDVGGQPFQKASNKSGNDTDNRRMRSAFMSAVGQALEAPLHLYDGAAFAGRDYVGGLGCSLWRARVRTQRPFAQLMQEATRGSRGGVDTLGTTLGSPGAAVLPSAEALLAFHAKSGHVAGESLGAESDAELDEQASFCVTELGALIAANSSRQVTVQVRRNATGPPTRFPLWSFAAQMVAELAPDPTPGAAVFDGTHGTAGGRCIDLTRGSTGDRELEAHLNSNARLERINREAHGHWRAGPYEIWEGITVRQVVPSLGAHLGPLSLPLGAESAGAAADEGRPPLLLLGVSMATAPANATSPPLLPAGFDARKRWPECQSIGFIRNQGMCGSCWAFASSAVLADRICIAKVIALEGSAPRSSSASATAMLQQDAVAGLALAPEHMVDCDVRNNGCAGGRLDDAWWFLRDHGIPSETCSPYKYCPVPTESGCAVRRGNFGAGGSIADSPPTCGGACAGGGAMQVFKASAAYAVAKPGDIAALQRDLMTNGPVEVGFFVFSDFHSYQSGVYFRTPGAFGPLGGHAVRLLGWGTSGNKRCEAVDYWVVANSWSPEWGLGGFFRIRRGTNECGIETTPAAGLPALTAEVVARPTVRPAAGA